MKFRLVIFSFVTMVISSSSFAQKRSIDEDAYSKWRRVDNCILSQDGRHVSYKYSYTNNEEKNEANQLISYLFDNQTKKTIKLDSVSNLVFQAAGKWLTYSQGNKFMIMRLKDKKVIEWTKSETPRFEKDGVTVSYNTNGGKDLVFYDLNSGDSIVYEGVSRVNYYENDDKIIYQKNGETSFDICFGNIAKGAKHQTLFSDKTKTLDGYYFFSDKNEGYFQVSEKVGDKDNCNLVYHFSLEGVGSVNKIFDKGDIKLEQTLFMDKSSFTRNCENKYIIFDVYEKKSEPTKKYDKSKKDTSFELELWSWNDSISQNIQAISGLRDQRTKPYIYVYNSELKKSYPVYTLTYNSIYTSKDVNCDYMVVSDEYPYSKNSDWEHDNRSDVYLVDLRTGERKTIKERTTNRFEWSPKGDYVIFYDSEKGAWMSLEPRSFTFRELSKGIDGGVANKGYDKPNPRPSYGMTGWSKDGTTLYINGRNDVWAVDITGQNETTCFTREYGKKNNYIVRLLNPDYGTMVVDPKKNQDLDVTDINNMDNIVATMTPDGKITKNIEGPFAIRVLKSSDDGKIYLYHKQSFRDDRDLWISDSKFKKPYKITDSNPQQKDYNWGTVEIVEWITYENKPNRGLLYLPEGYEKGKSYPTIVNFYETHTGEKNIYFAPSYSAAMLDVATYVSNGYIVFMPDVKFAIGEPGKSSYNTVVSGTKALIERGIIDPKRVGLQGHSWSGYQTSYLVTKTDIFTCVNIGAPIVNMTSAYNGIREGSGMPRMFMYEDWQCRMGSTMWEALDKFIESSPILYADKIKTPVLIFHCDKDEAVSFPEGRSLFLALRRLQQPAWMLNYKGEGHFVHGFAASQDWTRRMRQFFDYYLNNSPMPRWMSEGINVNERGYDQKLDYVK